MKNNEKPDILSKIKGIKLRRELTVLLAFFVMLSTSYVMIHPGEALNNSTARSFMFFNEEDGVTEETAVPDMNALLDADRDSGTVETAETEAPVQEEVQNEETAAAVTEEATFVPASTPAETVVPTLEPTSTPENIAEATGTPETLESAAPAVTEETENTSDPFSTASAEPVLEETSTPEATASASPEPSASVSPEATASAEPTATPEAEEEEYPAFSEENIVPLEEDGTETEENIRVFIKAAEGTFPEGTTVKVVLVRDTKVLEAIEQAVVEKAKEEDKDVKVNQVQAVDITFYDKDGNEIQPKDGSKVAVSFKSALIEEAEDTTVVHVEQDENKENVTNTNVMDKVEKAEDEDLVEKIDSDEAVVLADSFSIYGFAISETIEKEITIHSADGTDKIYVVSVTYGPDANIPDGSTVDVRPFEEGTEEYERARNAVLADKKEKNESVDIEDFNLAAMDISIIDPDGNEIEPSAAVTVDIRIKELPGVDNLEEIKESLEIQHHVEVTDGVVVEKVFDGSIEGSYTMDTNENIAKTGTAVDPTSVSEEDFKKDESEDEEEIDASFETDVFSTFTITWRTGYNARTVTVHYVDTNGNELTIANPANTHPNMYADSSSPAFLIYDIDGYEYSYTYRNTDTNANRIAPLLTKNGQNRWQYMGANSTSTTELSNGDNIYVVYKKKADPTTGGTPVIDDAQASDWPQDSATPQFGKSSTNNGNGTNTVSLSISGGEKPYERSTKANVIVVFDQSGSMGGDNIWRLNTAKSAVNTMAKTLLDGDITGVKMALVSFSTTASTVQEFTDDYGTYYDAVDELTASGGTNWEQALSVANRMAVDSDAATFVVFVTDGDPTFRISRGDVTNNNLDVYNSNTTYQYYRNNHVFGAGNSDNQGRNFDYAAEEVKSILASNKTFYAIGVSTDVTKVQNLVDEAGGGTAYLATDEDALKEAFANITQSIKTTLGFGDVEITDGITSMSSAEIKAVNVDPNSFKYYRIVDGVKTEWTTRAADGCGAATYTESDGAVHWDMGETFQLENGVTYVVEFTVWPSQASLDLVADLNNGIRSFDELTESEKSQVVEVTAPTETTTGTYALKTNTDKVEATYNRTSKTGETVTISDTTDATATYHPGTIQNMALDSDYITVKKEWHNALDSRVADGITLTVTKDGAVYLDDVALSDDNGWTSDEQYISAGFITKTSDGRYNVRETGHEYTVTEPASFSYYWDLTADTYRPMVIDGTLTMLIKTDSPTGTEGTDYYVINGNSYQVSDVTTPLLTARNDRRSNLNLKKLVTANTQAVDKVPNPDDTFTYTITVTDTNGDAVWFSAQDESGATVTIESYSSNVTPEIRDGSPTGSYSVPSGAQFTISIKAGWNVRFFNLPTGTTYSIQETGMEDGYEFVKAETSAEVTNPDYADDYQATPGTVSGDTVTGTIDQPNNVYSTEYTNNWNPNNEIVIIKTDESDEKLAGAEFKLSKKSDSGWTEIATFTSKADAGETLKVGRGLYKLEETAAPTSYSEVETVYFKVETSGNTTTVTLTDEDGDETTYTDATASGNEVTLKNWPLTTADALKAWKNADRSTTAPAGASVVYTLYIDGEASSHTVTLDGTAETAPTGTDPAGYESAGWKATFVNLPKYKVENGEKAEIAYTIAETTTYPGYTPSTTDPVASGGTITNTQESTTADATKEWVNADGTTTAPQGGTVTYTLYADGKATSYTVTLDGTADEEPEGTAGYEIAAWKATFVNLPKYQAGTTTAIVYTIAETGTYPGYTPSTEEPVASGESISNTQEPTTANALKAWVNADGSTTPPTGATVEFTLYADGTATDYTVTLDGNVDAEPTGTAGYESAAWTATFVNLPKYQTGTTTEITYTVAETTTYPGYTASPTTPVASGGTITNTQEATEADATKAWKNADGSTTAPEGATVVFTLYADGTATGYTVTLDGTADEEPEGTAGYESEGWKALFINLPKYKTGTTTEIVYTVAETTTYPGYTPSTTDPVASGGTITNEQEATTADATKAWKNADGSTTAPDGGTVTFTLYADGTATSYTVILDGTVDATPAGTAGYESEAWKALFINLPKYQKGTTTEIVYTVAETGTYPGYTPSTTTPVASGSTITNEQGATETFALKAWKNADGTTTAPEGGSVVFTLYADGTATSHTVTLDGTADTAPTVTGGYESEPWKATFVKLPETKIVDGKAVEIVYTIAETTTYPGYTASTTDPVGSGSTITNSQDPTTANALKAWVNADGTTDAPQGGTVTYTLYADGEATKYTVTLDGTADTAPEVTGGYESAAWKAEFINLPKYQTGTTTEIVYTIAETGTYPGYTASTTDPVESGGTITNTQEPTEADATKEWKNADGTTTAPEGATVVFTLYSDGTATNYTVTLDGAAGTAPTGAGGYESEAWKAQFVKLPKYKVVDGEAVEIVYTVAETTTYPGYTPSTTEPVASGETITNTQKPTEADALKAWVNADGTTTAPEGATVVFTLYSDGAATNYTVALDGTVDETVPTGTAGYESEAWKATFVNLPESKIVDGAAVKIEYTVAETTTYPGYTPSTTDPVASGGTITNEQDPTEADATKEWKNADGTTEAPQGATVVFTLYADGETTEYTVTLDGSPETAPEKTGGHESEAWKATFIKLPKYKIVNNTAVEIVYTVAETTEYPGYTKSPEDPVESGETITNTQDDVDIDAIKAWKNADGTATPPEGATVEFTLYADGEVTEYVVTLDGKVDETVPTGTAGYESAEWKASFINLPKYKIVEGKAVEIEYTVDETTAYPGYTADNEEPVASGETITNEQEPTEVFALKKWENADGSTTAPEGATVVFTLYADGKELEPSVTVTLDGEVDEVPEGTAGYESAAWTATFINLPKYQADGETAIEYTIAETTGYEGYKASTTEPVASGESITNSQLSAEIKLKKIGDGKEETVLDDAEFELYSVWKGAGSAENIKAKNVSGVEIGTIKTAGGGLATIGKLLPGTYYLVETKAPAGYNLLTDPVEIYIQLIDREPGYTVSYKQKDYDQSSAAGNLDPDTDGAYLITVSDPSGSALPHTGGTGTLPYTLGGLTVMLTALMYGFRMRRRERRLN